MFYEFREDLSLDKDELRVQVRAAERSRQVETLLTYLEHFQPDRPEVLPIKTPERIELLEVSKLILAEVDADYLVLSTTEGQLRVRERLYKFEERLSNPDFIQISRYALVNIKWLKYLENSFSGNMMAFLKNGQQIVVSRRYLKALSQRLGL